MKQIIKNILLLALLIVGISGANLFNNNVIVFIKSVVPGNPVTTWNCADVRNWETGNGAIVQNWYCGFTNNGGSRFTQDNQKWTAQDMGGNTYQLVNKYSGKCLDVYNYPSPESKLAGQSLQQWACSGANNQRWTYQVSAIGGNPQLKNVWSGFCLAYCPTCPLATQLIQTDCSDSGSRLSFGS